MVIHGEVVANASTRYPYFVLVGDYCGGSLIAPDIVLTAGHCRSKQHPLSLRIAPRHRYYHHRHRHHHDSIASIRQVRHPDYVRYGDDEFANDFLLVQLAHPVANAQVLRMSKDYIETSSSSSTDSTSNTTSSTVTAIGMGWTDKYRPSRADQLHSVQLSVISNTDCAQSSGRNETYYDRIGASMMCSTGGPHNERDTCNCDSGSPLLLQLLLPAGRRRRRRTSDDWQEDRLIGMVSWGMECADPDFPAVNSRISAAYEWIRNTTCDLSRHPPTYLQCGGGRGGTQSLPLPLLPLQRRRSTTAWVGWSTVAGILLVLYYVWRRCCWNSKWRTSKQYSSIADADV